MEDSPCPRCKLPIDEGAWQCDGCGHVFDGDYDKVHKALQRNVRSSKTELVVTTLFSVIIIATLATLAFSGFFFFKLSLTLGIAIVAGLGHAAHRISVSSGHLKSFERRLPKATIANR